MTTTTGTMTRDQAAALITARGTDAKLLGRKPKHELVAIYQSEGGFGGGTWFKGDLVSSILEKRFPMARQNEATHVLHHEGGGFSACEFCRCQQTWMEGPFLAQCGQAPGHDGDHRVREQASVGAE